MNLNELQANVDTSALLSKTIPEWRGLLASEVQVYVFGENYIGKRFDQIHYKFCEKDEAKEILIDNLYALLRYKYFPKVSEEIDEKIREIVMSFTQNIKTALKKVSYDRNANCDIIKMIPDSCVAFRNGVFDFKRNKWLFKYDIIELRLLSNVIYMYDPQYTILWYMDYDFEPLPIDVMETSFDDFFNIMRELAKTQQNYCFELLYNMSHNSEHRFTKDKMIHLCEILGYTLLQSFSQYFVMLIGNGQNGKNSLFDGCFINRVVPKPAANDLDAIETDRFITGALENKTHNIFLETAAKTYTESKMIKALTGSMYQTIEPKGINKYSGVINCKYIFAGNDQEKIKFSDTTVGFRRRINMFEISYQWDALKRFLTRGDYYDTTFSDSLSELKEDIVNTTTYIYFGIYGLLSATRKFTRNFKFDYNDWNMRYADVDLDLKEKLDNLTIKDFVMFGRRNANNSTAVRNGLYDMLKVRLYSSGTVKVLGIKTFEELMDMLISPEESSAYFSENDIYISIRLIEKVCASYMTSTMFTQAFKKIYGISSFPQSIANVPFVKCSFANGKMKVLL